jgi:hypothetical protein
MSCLGVLFSLDGDTVRKIKSFQSDTDRLEYLQEEVEETYFEQFPDRVAELDKSWDALHRSLTDGKLEYSNGSFPVNHIILGGEILYEQGNYIITLKTPEQVKEIAEAVEKLNEVTLRNGYFKIDSTDYGFPLTDEDFEYTWAWFEDSKEFWKLASKESRFVLFTADQ